MSFIRGAIKSTIAIKALQIARREASKPENQRKVKDFINRVSNGQRRTPRA